MRSLALRLSTFTLSAAAFLGPQNTSGIRSETLTNVAMAAPGVADDSVPCADKYNQKGDDHPLCKFKDIFGKGNSYPLVVNGPGGVEKFVKRLGDKCKLKVEEIILRGGTTLGYKYDDSTTKDQLACANAYIYKKSKEDAEVKLTPESFVGFRSKYGLMFDEAGSTLYRMTGLPETEAKHEDCLRTYRPETLKGKKLGAAVDELVFAYKFCTE